MQKHHIQVTLNN